MSTIHDELVKLAARKVGKKCSVVITEMASGAMEEPDVLGFDGQGNTILVECKASRADFKRDIKKWHRQEQAAGMGYFRYFCVPPNILAIEEIPAGWGLWKTGRGGIHTLKKSSYFPNRSQRKETLLLLSAIRRIGLCAPKGISVRAYTLETKCRATLGILPLPESIIKETK